MVLISNRYKFIYIKTIKTAGTSIEAYLLKFCYPPELEKKYESTHATDEYIGPSGLVVARSGKNTTGLSPHTPASIIKKIINPQTVWDQYLKICVIRNPWDCAVSMYSCTINLHETDKPLTGNKKLFKEFLKTYLAPNWLLITINDLPVINFYIRFEHLLEDLKSLCEKLGVPYEPEKLDTYKMNRRDSSKHYSYYYDDESRKYIENMCKNEIELFGYTF